MQIQLQSAKIIDPTSSFHGDRLDILICDGIIEKIDKKINADKATVIARDDLHLSSGWFDSNVSFGEPGYEERETLSHGLHVAATSGFAHIAYNTNTNPLPTTKADIAFLMRKTADTPTLIHPKAHITTKSKNNQLADLNDLSLAGAVGFSNNKTPIDNPHMLLLALQYARGFDGLIESFPLDPQLCVNGVMHEGIMSTSLGLTGIPNLAEEIRIRRDLSILAYTGGKLHIPTISTAQGVALIRQAKKENLDVSCSVAIHNLMLTDAELEGFDTRFKLMPPLRESSDQKALIKGIKDGTIDMVTSDHQPMDIEHKKMEFEHAAHGSIGLETAYGSLCALFDNQEAATLLSKGKERFGLETSSITKGNRLNVTLFNPEGHYTFSKNDIHSKSKNSIFDGHSLKGKVYGIINNNQIQL